MGKKIYINESMLNDINFRKGVLTETISKKLIHDIVDGKTSLGKDSLIPPRELVDFFMDNMDERGNFDELSIEEEEERLNSLILLCQENERPIRQELEQMCFNLILDLFEIPDESISFEMELVDKIEDVDSYVRFDTIDGDQFLEAPTDLHDELYKHRFLSMLAMGGGIHAEMNDEYHFIDMVAENFGEELASLYEEIIDLTLDLLFKKNIVIDEKNPNLMGCSEVDLASENEVVTIKSKGTILPVLMIETVRGLMELFISHGLPKDMKQADYILGKTECLKNEPWDIRMGLILWGALTSEVESKYLPYLIKLYAQIPADKFNRVIWAILTHDEEGDELFNSAIAAAKHEYEKYQFQDRMGEMNGKSMIADEYIHPDEF